MLRCVRYATAELSPGLCQDLAALLSPEIEEAFYLAASLGLLFTDLLDYIYRDILTQREAANIKVGWWWCGEQH